ncbi:response regulator [Undibacterium sp. JH2W]|uniref:response regulator n=1 Tax=Undibacterium sp. JH2W TaxID=3413037 RepID=UPI003BF12B0C
MPLEEQENTAEYLDDSLVISAEEEILKRSPPWRILIVDDDHTTHTATCYSLENQSFRQRRFEFISAYSSEQAFVILRDTPDIALVILDIIMETSDAGLQLVKRIRNELNNHLVRIVLRTGQPGLVPEHRIVMDFDIDDYKSKTELGSGKLFTMVVCALRAYDNLCEMMAAQKALGNSLKKIQNLETALNQHAIYVILDRSGNIIAVNDKFCSISGFSSIALMGKTFDQLCLQSTTSSALNDMRAAMDKGEIWQGTIAGKSNLCKPYWMNTSVVPFMDHDNQPQQYVVVATDVTEAKLAQQEVLELNRDLEQRVIRRTNELEMAKLAAEKANDAKSIFLANMSHEIRTPLNAIFGYAQLLSKDERLPAELTSIVAPIEKSGVHLLNLINDILDLSKIEAGRMTLEFGQIDLESLVAEVSDIFAMRCSQKGIHWHCAVNFAPESYLLGDGEKLRQVLLNLLSNAVKFTDCGEVVLTVTESASDKPDHTRLSFEVRDTGLGIPLEQQSLVFAPFHQAEPNSKRGGTGLGLAISNRQVELMGSRLQLVSSPERGSRFYFELELLRMQNAVPASSRPVNGKLSLLPGQALNILVVDDIEENRDVLARMLQSLGATVRQAENGALALESLRAAPADIVFLDIRMPVMDGIEAMRHIRAEWPRPQPKCVALTASALLHEREHYMLEGFDDFIGKPFLFETIYACLSKQLGLRFTSKTDDMPALPAKPDMSKLPEHFRERLLTAAKTGWVSGLESALAELKQCGTEEAAIASHLTHYLMQYDMDGLERELMTGSQHV